MARLIRAHDWAATPLGEIASWSERLRGAVEQMLESPILATLAWGPERVLLYNDAAVQLYGDRHPAALGRPLARTWPEAYPDVAHFYARAFAGEALQVPAQPLDVSRTGGEVFDVVLTPVRDEAGAVMAVLMTGFEVGARFLAETTLRDSEERQAFLLRLSDALRPIADPMAIQGEACRVLGEYLRVDRAAYGEIDATAQYVTVHHDYHAQALPSVAGRYRIEDYGAGTLDTLRRGRIFVLEDARLDPQLADPGIQRDYAAMRVRAAIVIPLIKAGRLVALLTLQQSTPRAWTATELRLIEDTAERTWAAVERARAEAAQHDSEAQLRAFGEASSDVLWIRDAQSLEWTYLSPAFERIYGQPCRDALSGDTFGNWVDLILPEDRAAALAQIARVRDGARVTFEYRIRRPSDGEIRRLRNTDFPIRDLGGRVVLIGGVGHDITEAQAAQEALIASERRLRTLTEGIPQLVWTAVNVGEWTWSSPQWSAYTGLSTAQSLGYGWLAALHPEDRDATMALWRGAAARGAFEAEYRLRQAAAGQGGDGAEVHRWFQTRATPVRDDGGRIVEWLGTTTDVQDLGEMQERQGVLVAELQHRTRNLLGVVRAIMATTLRGSASLEEFVPVFRSRLEALARVNGLLSRLREEDRIAFDELIAAELAALGALDGARHGPRVTLASPEGVRLRSGTVQTLALALHELATNALKYGALAQPGGRLAVRWHRVPGRAGAPDGARLRIEWTETGVAMPEPGAPPRGSGYGRELIERALPYQLRAETTYELGPDGVRCTIVLPLSSTEEGTHA